jgi:transcriptional regulator with XRE-family HTH domain
VRGDHAHAYDRMMGGARRYCRCGTALARDNLATLCSACQANRRRDRPPEVPSVFWQTDVMADALDSGDLGQVVRAYRFHPFHGQPLPQAVVADWLHVSQATLSRIESGSRRLTIDDVNGFARRLGVPWTLRWTAQREAREDVEPISRRSLLGAGVGAAFGLGATIAPAAAREIDPDLVPHWTNLLDLFESHGAMFGSHDVLAALRGELDVIAEHRQLARGDLRTQLLRLESRWSEFASWLSNDAGDPARRDYWGERALRLAREGEYPDMVAWALMWRSQWAVQDLDARRAIALADAARRTPGSTHQMGSLCARQQACAHALGDDAASCERRLAEASDLLDHPDASPTPELGAYNLTPPYVMVANARCWIELQPCKAIAMFEDALRIWPHDRALSRGVQQARLALACAAADELERAAAEGLNALRVAKVNRSNKTTLELRRLDRRLAACDAPAVVDFREAFATL